MTSEEARLRDEALEAIKNAWAHSDKLWSWDRKAFELAEELAVEATEYLYGRRSDDVSLDASYRKLKDYIGELKGSVPISALAVSTALLFACVRGGSVKSRQVLKLLQKEV